MRVVFTCLRLLIATVALDRLPIYRIPWPFLGRSGNRDYYFGTGSFPQSDPLLTQPLVLNKFLGRLVSSYQSYWFGCAGTT